MTIIKLLCRLPAGVLLLGVIALGAQSAFAAEATTGCDAISSAIGGAGTLHAKLAAVMTDGKALSKGLALRQWATIVDKNGVVCTVVESDPSSTDVPWLGSRVISAQKANTSLDYSTNTLALSTANLWAATQPGGSLFGLQLSNPVNPTVAYGDNSDCTKVGCDSASAPDYGQADDPMVGHYIGGNNVFGGGLPLYDSSGKLIGALGTSGNTSCADHYISWVVRDRLGLDNVPGGVADAGADDNIIFDVTGSHGNFSSKSGFGHPLCGIDSDEANYPKELVTNYPIGPNPSP